MLIALVLAGLLDTQLRGRTLWRMSVLLPFVVAPAAVALIFGNVFGDRYGLVNEVVQAVGLDPIRWHVDTLASHVAIASMVNWRWTGYNALIFLAAMQAVPRDLYESAALDGAGRVRQFLSVTVPMIRPTLIFVIITSTIGGLQIFAEPRLFDTQGLGGSDRQYQTLTMYLWELGWRGARPRHGLGGGVAAVPHHRGLRGAQPGDQPPGRIPARCPMNRRPGFLVYGLLTAFVLGSCAPLYWSFLVGSHSREVLTKRVPPLLPGGHFWDNAQRAFDAVPFWKALGNSLIVSGDRRDLGRVLLDAGRLRLRQAGVQGTHAAAGLRRRHDGGADPARRDPAVHRDGQDRLGRLAVGADRARAW